MKHLRKEGAALVYRCAKQHSEPTGDKRGGTELAAQCCGNGVGPGCTGATGHGAGRASHHGRWRAWGGTAGQCDPTHARTCAAQAFPLLCPMCGGQMRLIAFITEGTQIRQILNHIGVESEPPHIAPARGPPLWDGCDAREGEGPQIEPDWDLAAQPAPDYEVDQRVNW